ncbi:hypothetical protein D3C81_1880010 [compost metagenome]
MPGITEQRLAGIGGQYIAIATHQQAVADHVFQAPHFLADGRLGGMQTCGSGGKAAAVGHHDNGPKQVQIEQRPIRFYTDVHVNI